MGDFFSSPLLVLANAVQPYYLQNIVADFKESRKA